MKKNGFTLIEIIAVVAILGFLAIVAIPNIIKLFSRSTEETMKIQETNVLDAAKLFVEDYCRNPIDNAKLTTCNNSKKTLFIYGDVNNDGITDILDTTKFNKHLNGTRKIDDELLERGDIDLNDTIDSNDKSIFNKYLVNNLGSIVYPERVYFCLSDLYTYGYLKEDVSYKSGIKCNGIIAFSKTNRTYSLGKTFLKCGNNEYTTIDYSNANYSNYKSAIEGCADYGN